MFGKVTPNIGKGLITETKETNLTRFLAWNYDLKASSVIKRTLEARRYIDLAEHFGASIALVDEDSRRPPVVELRGRKLISPAYR